MAKLNSCLNEDEYSILDNREHVLLRSDVYMGSKTEYRLTRLVHKIDEDKFEKRQIVTVDAIERLFIEVLTNATDAINRKSNKKDCNISVLISNSKIVVRNEGSTIPLVKSKKENMWIPEMIFGVLLSSSNYSDDKNRSGAGKNGCGAKLTNIMSKRFSCKIGNSELGKVYFQEWKKSMSICSEPLITKDNKTKDFVEISYTLDFSLFSTSMKSYSKDMVSLLLYHCVNASLFSSCVVDVTVDVSGSASISTKSIANTNHKFTESINGSADTRTKSNIKSGTKSDINENVSTDTRFSTSKDTRSSASTEIKLSNSYNLNLSKYCKTMMPNYLSHVEFKFEKDNINAKIALIDVQGDGSLVSITNGIENINGGKHIDEIYNDCRRSIVEAIMSKSKDTGKRAPTIRSSKFSDSISIVCITQCDNPEFESQCKTKLTSPLFFPKIPDELKKKLSQWKITNSIAIELQSMKINKANKNSKTGRNGIAIKKVDDANLAGKKSDMCTLFIVEGNSAKGYPECIISNIQRGRDFIGIFPLQGKPLNVLNADPISILDNEVFTKLRKVLGLEEGKEYTSLKQLRYNKIEVLVDADEDGKHILGLIVLFFYSRFRSLLSFDFLYYMRTPIIRASRGDVMKAFFSKSSYDEWSLSTPDSSSWKVHYFKGLGSSSPEDIAKDLELLISVSIKDDEDSLAAINLCFNDERKYSEQRKEWLANIKVDNTIITKEYLSINNIIHNEVSQYSIANNGRSLPMLDGLKISQRKALWTAIKFCKPGKFITFLEFVGQIMKHTYYSHGDASISNAIILMTSNCVGTNNMPYFSPKGGQYGNRTKGPKGAASPRYLKTMQSNWISHMYLKEDEPILSFVKEHGKKAEPEVLLPILPMILINGAAGVGSGWKTDIPSYSISSIIKWLKKRLNFDIIENSSVEEGLQIDIDSTFKLDFSTCNNDFPELELWNRHYKGTIEQEGTSITYSGNFTLTDETLRITELPVGIYSDKLKNVLDELKKEKIIKNYQRNDTINNVDFTIEGVGELIKDEAWKKVLLLSKTVSTKNINYIDEKGIIKCCNNSMVLIEDFYQFRLPYFIKRKNYYIEQLSTKINLINEKLKLIDLFNNDIIIVKGKKKDELIREVTSHNISIETFNCTKYEDACLDEIDKLKNNLNKLVQERKELLATSAQKMWLKDIKKIELWLKNNEKEFELFSNLNKKTYGKKK